MANGKISGDPIATTSVGVYMAAIQGGANVQAPSTLFAANQFNLADLSNPAQALLNLGGLSSALAASTYLTQADAALGYQPLAANLTSWAAITRASGLDAFVATPSSANLAALLTDETGTGAAVFASSPTLVAPVLGAASATSLNLSGLTASNAVQTDGSKNLVSVANTGTGNNVLATSPTLVTPALGTPSSGVATNLTGLPLTTGVTGTLPLGNGGTGQTTSPGALNAVSGVTSTAYGRSLLTMTAAADLRLAGVVPTYCTLAQLVALDTSKDAAAFVTDLNISDWFQWSGTDLSARTVLQSVTTTTVTPATDTLTKVAHGLSTGAGLMPTTTVNGVTANTAYYAIVIDADNFKLATSPTNAIAGTPVVDITGSTNFTLKQLRDPRQTDFIIPTGVAIDGTAGAWIRIGASHGFGLTAWTYKRFPDRVLFGRGATGWYGDTSGMGSSGAGSWLGDELAPGSAFAMSYLLQGAQVASVPDYTPGMPTLGVLGAARTPDGATNNVGYGIAGFFSGHGTSLGSVGWGAYIEGVKRPGSNTTVNGLELEITNLNSTPVSPVVTPEATYVQGRTFAALIGSGGGNTTAYDADWAMRFTANGAKFRTGIVFATGSLTQDVTTLYQHAILLPTKARVEWYTSDLAGNYAFTIHSEVTDAAHQIFMIASNTGLSLFNTAGLATFNFAYVASAVNLITYSPGAAGVGPNFQVGGSDTNADLSLISKGTGGVRLRDGSANNKLVINTTGIGFFNVTPVARGALAAPTGTITRTTYDTTTVTLPQLAERVYAIINDMRAYGLFS